MRYRRGYLPEFEPLMPYDVLCVSLEERTAHVRPPRRARASPSIGMAVQAIVERFPGGECVPAFVARGDGR